MTKNTHSIQRVFLEINTPSMSMANAIKNDLAMFMQNEVTPILEKQFNLIENTDNQIIQIEKLEIYIQSDTEKNDTFFSKIDIKNQIEKEIQKAINELQKKTKNDIKKESEILTLSSEDKDLKTLLYFIENGSMPWWEDGVAFFEKINFEKLKKDVFTPFGKLIQQKNIQKRIINQFSNQEIAFFTSALLDSKTQQKALSENSLLSFIKNKSHEFKSCFWYLFFDASNKKKTTEIIQFYHQNRTEFLSEKISFELFVQSLKVFFPLNISDDELKKINNNYLSFEKAKSTVKSESANENLKEEKNNSKSFYVQNAGLIILHPFINEMLKNCNLISDNNSITNKELAAHILHYAATKKENDYEHAMLFEKFLCGIPIQQSIKREISIEEKHKHQVEEMLLSVVEHWSALKNTSTDVVRTEFLQREGKLDLGESNPKLNIERKTQDLLLEKIPWNINIIKIPWIEKLIYTQW